MCATAPYNRFWAVLKTGVEKCTRTCAFQTLCLRTAWSYASVLSGAMPPYCRELCLHTAWSYASILCGAMPPYCMELCLRTVGSYASVLCGVLPPYCVELCLHTAWSYPSVLRGGIPSFYRLRCNRKRFSERAFFCGFQFGAAA